jgi:SAM-dependent methyltransferase
VHDDDTGWGAEHERHVADALAGDDAGRVKRVYVQLGELLERAYGDDAAAAPLLSLPETVPVVARMLAGVHGLLLDAGCGPHPAAAIAMAGGGRRFVVLDLGPGTVRVARSRAAGDGVDVLGVVGDVEALPFRSGAYAGGLCDDTIEHLPHDELGVRELARVLAPGARMVLATPNRRALSVLVRRTRDLLRRQRHDPRHYFAATSHLREYTWAEFERLVAPHLRVRTRGAVGWSGGWKQRAATAVTAVAPLRRLSRMVVLDVEPRRGGH